MRNGRQLFQLEEMTTSDMPSVQSFFDHFKNFRMRADIDTACGLIEDQKSRLRSEPTGKNCLLLVAA